MSISFFVLGLVFFCSSSSAAFASDCQRAVEPRPLGLTLPLAKAELEHLRYLPTIPLVSTSALYEALPKILPRGDFEAMLTSEHHLGDPPAKSGSHPIPDRVRLSWGGPMLEARGLALRATFSKGRQVVTQVDLPLDAKTLFDVGLHQNRYHASFSSLRSTIVFQYDDEGQLVKIFAFRREKANSEREPVRGTYRHFLVPRPLHVAATGR